jgi:hypothetical protein
MIVAPLIDIKSFLAAFRASSAAFENEVAVT